MLEWSGFDEIEAFFDAQDTFVHAVEAVGNDGILGGEDADLAFNDAEAALDVAQFFRMPVLRRTDGAQMLEDEIFGCR